MNIIANNVASKLFVAFVATAMLFTLVTPAKAATTEELQAQIAALMAQIAALQGSVGGSSSSCASIPAPLTMGAQNADVTALQNFLISAGQSIPAGATGYFGGQTQSALAAWQAANGVSPAVGYYGPITQAAVDAKCVMTDDHDQDMDDDDSSTGGSSSVSLGGEASRDTFELDPADDDSVEEGADDVEVAEITVSFQDGDAMITRLDVAFTATGEEDAWDTFSDVSLWIDGDEVGRESADRKGDYLGDEDDGVIRFSGLDIVAMEDEDVVIVVAASFQNAIDNLPATWSVDIDSMRFVDGDDVTTTESATDLGVTAVTFDLEEKGGDDELIVKTSTSDPDGTTLQVEDDAKSDWFTVFIFDLDSDDSVNDITLNTVSVNVAVSSSTYNTIVDDAELIIDGTTIDSNSADVTNGTALTGTIAFDVDEDVVIDAGDRVKAELRLRFKSLALGNEGVTVRASTTGTTLDADGADDLSGSQLSGAATGEYHTLRTSGLDVSAGDMTAAVTAGDNALDDYGTFTVELEVTAFEQDVYISTNPVTSLTYVLEDSTGSTSVAGTRSAVLTSTADEVGSTFEVTEGSTETLTLTVTYTPGVANTASRLNLNTLIFGSTSGTPTGQTWTASPDADYRTSVVTMVN
jgi:hypothetical protein